MLLIVTLKNLFTGCESKSGLEIVNYHFDTIHIDDHRYKDIYDGEPNRKIIGGYRAWIKSFPHHVTIQLWNSATKHWETICGGTIISEKWVLTAAHCIMISETYRYGKEQLRIVSGLDEVSSIIDVRYHTIKELIAHFDYLKRPGHWMDAALIKVENEFVFDQQARSPNVRSVILPDKNLNQSSLIRTYAHMVGFGQSTPDAEVVFPEKLQGAQLTIYDMNICEHHYPNPIDRETSLCAGNPEMYPCKGDAGGGLVTRVYTKAGEKRFLLLGFLSYVPEKGPCGYALNVPSVFIFVPSIIGWIKGTINYFEDQVPPSINDYDYLPQYLPRSPSV